MYPYSIVEVALSQFFEVIPAALLAFRAKIRNLQRLGLVKGTPGRGYKREYNFNDVCDLALALSLADFGADPSRIVETIIPGLFEMFENMYDLEKLNRSMYVVFNPSYVTGVARNTEMIRLVADDEEGFHALAGASKRIGVINITVMRCALRQALGGQSDDEHS